MKISRKIESFWKSIIKDFPKLLERVSGSQCLKVVEILIRMEIRWLWGSCVNVDEKLFPSSMFIYILFVTMMHRVARKVEKN